MHLLFSPEAQLEFGNARRYYNQQLSGLGEALA